jgi:hypothetical protein
MGDDRSLEELEVKLLVAREQLVEGLLALEHVLRNGGMVEGVEANVAHCPGERGDNGLGEETAVGALRGWGAGLAGRRSHGVEET